MKPLQKFTIEDIRSWRPCYDPERYLVKDWFGTALDLVTRTDIPWNDVLWNDVLWVVARKECVDEGLLRRFAAWCAAEALFLTKFADKRSWNAVEVSVRFSLGEVDDAAWAAAWDAVWDAARDAAWAAAGAAAWDAAGDAAGDAQRGKLASMLRGESDFTLSDILNNYPLERT